MDNKTLSPKKYIYKQKLIKKKAFLHRLRRTDEEVKRFKKKKENVPQNNLSIPQENRINFEYMAKKLECNFCKEESRLQNIVSENRGGSGSLFSLRCYKCSSLSNKPNEEKKENVTNILDKRTPCIEAGQTNVNKLFQNVENSMFVKHELEAENISDRNSNKEELKQDIEKTEDSHKVS